MSDSTHSDVLYFPALDPETGCLPAGRYPTSLHGLRSRFVDHEEYEASTSRAAVWEGFLTYIAAWEQVEDLLGERIVLAWWVGGSFVTSAVDVGDIDVTPVLDREVWQRHRGSEGMGTAKGLIKHRQKVRDTFGVEPFALLWSAVPCTLFPEGLAPPVQEMLRHRGGLDAWWQRRRPQGEKMAPELPTVFAERGYVEVER